MILLNVRIENLNVERFLPGGKGEAEAEKDVSPGELKDEDEEPERECA